MSRSEPRKETRIIQVVDPQSDPEEEVFPVSDNDHIVSKIYIPITSTYKLEDGADKEAIISNLCKGLQATLQQYRPLTSTIYVDTKGKLTMVRTAEQTHFTVHINHLEDTDYPSYAHLEQHDFPISELDARLLPPTFSPAAAAVQPCGHANRTEGGLAVMMVQINPIRGGLILGTVIHHHCCDAGGVDAVMTQWAANTRAAAAGAAPAPFDARWLDRSPLISSSPAPPQRLREIEQRLQFLKYVPPEEAAEGGGEDADTSLTSTGSGSGSGSGSDNGHSTAPPPTVPEMACAIIHFPAPRLAALKALMTPGDGSAQWASTNDCVTALLWRCVTRARLPYHSQRPSSSAAHTRMVQAVGMRRFLAPPLPPQFLGNAVVVAPTDLAVADLLAPATLPTLGVRVREGARRFADAAMARDLVDFVAGAPERTGIQFDFDIFLGLDLLVTSWAVMDAYKAHDFGFGGLKALRWAKPPFDGLVFVYPRRPKDDPEEGVEMCVTLEKGCMERFLADEELARFAHVRGY